MSDNPDKNTTIAQVYGEFFGSVADTLRDARKKDPSIKLQDVKDWFAKNFVRKTNLRGYNSYVANYAHQEYQMDLFFINDLEDQDYKIGLLVVDIFEIHDGVSPEEQNGRSYAGGHQGGVQQYG